jgi:hypothetical protein
MPTFAGNWTANWRCRPSPDGEHARLAASKRSVTSCGSLASMKFRMNTNIRKIGPNEVQCHRSNQGYWTRPVSYFISLVVLLCAGCGSKEVPPLEKPRLGKLELQKWLRAEFGAAKPIRFFSSNGMRMCCEYPNISLEICPDQTVRIAIDGWAPKQYTAPYTIQDDGKIALTPGRAYPFARLQSDDITDVYMVRDGSDMYLVESSNSPEAPVTRTLWPLKFIASGDWLPDPR